MGRGAAVRARLRRLSRSPGRSSSGLREAVHVRFPSHAGSRERFAARALFSHSPEPRARPIHRAREPRAGPLSLPGRAFAVLYEFGPSPRQGDVDRQDSMIRSTKTPLEQARQGATGAMLGPDVIDVWFITDMVLCNFDCAYCCAYSVVTQQEAVARGGQLRALPQDHRGDREDALHDAHAGANAGRAAGLQAVSRARRLADVTGQHRLRRAGHERFALYQEAALHRRAGRNVLSKLSLWATYHHTEIKMEKFFAEVEYAQERGCFVVVNSLAFPDNHRAWSRSCTRSAPVRGLRINVDPGYRDGGGEYDQRRSAGARSSRCPAVASASSDSRPRTRTCSRRTCAPRTRSTASCARRAATTSSCSPTVASGRAARC